MDTLIDVFERLEELANKWENVPYTGGLTSAAYSICAKELRNIVGTRVHSDTLLESWAKDD